MVKFDILEIIIAVTIHIPKLWAWYNQYKSIYSSTNCKTAEYIVICMPHNISKICKWNYWNMWSFQETPHNYYWTLSNTLVKRNNSSLDKPWSNFNLAPADNSGCWFQFFMFISYSNDKVYYSMSELRAIQKYSI